MLPNAIAELDMLINDFEISPNRAYIIPNGADSLFEHSDGAEFKRKYGLQDFVLCVGRIEPNKNQLMLIRAMKGSGLPLVLIGKCGDKEYLKRCLNESKSEVKFLEAMPHSDLRSAYGAAKVHALPSWRETPGLVSLEAGLAGCNVVVTNRGSTEEYFRDLAFYCEPDDVSSIRSAVIRAFNAPRTRDLADHIFKNYTWEKAAEKTLDAYKSIIAEGSARDAYAKSPSLRLNS